MQAVVHPSRIGAGSDGLPRYTPPPSKSHFQRLCAAALLRKGQTEIKNAGRSEDDAAALRIVEALGATVERIGGSVRITSSGAVRPRTGAIHCGESGLSARLFTPIAALAAERVEIHGEGSLLARPMQAVVDGLQRLGVSVSSTNGRLPLVVQGPLQPQDLVIDGSQSSQIASGLLFALAAAARHPVVLRAEGLVSRPYLAMSCNILETAGWNVRFDGLERCYVEPGTPQQAYEQLLTEADWSSAAPLAVAAAFGGPGLDIDARRSAFQADAAILEILSQAGSQVDELPHAERVTVTPSPLRAFRANCTHAPDLIPILAILATACTGRSRIDGLHRLTYKESDRAKTTSALLADLGIQHHIEENAFVIDGPQLPRSATVQGCNDHRIVMAAAVAALRADGPITIEGAEAVGKSYPEFFHDLLALGVRVDVN